MKVGFLNYWCSTGPNYLQVSDYQADMLFHGLKRLIGHDCIEEWPYSHMYKELSDENKAKIWGKGFTVYGNLERDLDPPDVPDSAELFVLPVHWSAASYPGQLLTWLYKIEKEYPYARFALVDGWDRPDIGPGLLEHCRKKKYPYFKRELYENIEGVFPISFAFPMEKMQLPVPKTSTRTTDVAPLIPVNQSIDPSYMKTYIYNDEESYYQMYRNSKFALTSKKGGWDTLRHYEIMANGCLPVFVDINKCPDNTLTTLPKDLFKRINRLHGLKINTPNWVDGHENELAHCGCVDIDNPGLVDISDSRIDELRQEMIDHFLMHNTTTVLAERFLEVVDDYH